MSSLFGKTPKVEPPAPLPDEQQLDQSRRKYVARAEAQSGRSSTLLSTGGRETLGAK